MPERYDIDTDVIAATPEDPATFDGEVFPFQAIPLNGFLYRFNRQTGTCWRLQPDPKAKTEQIWQLVKEPIDGA